jgi:CPA2 family monovalent cation:H+ antiporter-2
VEPEVIECAHGDMIQDVPLAGDECPECVALGDRWVHLRVCMTCGVVGCCDSSKNRHAHRHADAAGHPIIRSLQPGESWMWCFVDEVYLAEA